MTPKEPQSPIAGDVLMDPKTAAAFMGLSAWTLAEWRCAGTGPRFAKLGGRVRYPLAEVSAWIAARTAASTSEHDARKAG